MPARKLPACMKLTTACRHVTATNCPQGGAPVCDQQRVRRASPGMPFRNCGDESQRDSGSKPKVVHPPQWLRGRLHSGGARCYGGRARNELPWGMRRKTNNPNGVAAQRLKLDATPLGLKTIEPGTQGSSFLATLGWKTQSLWDCRTFGVPSVRPEFPFDQNSRKALALDLGIAQSTEHTKRIA